MIRVLVTGGAGFIGANLARRLLREGHEVHLLVRPGFDPWRIREIRGEVCLHNVDLTDAESLRQTVRKIRAGWVFHLAAHGGYSWQTDMRRILETNLLGTINLLEGCLRPGFEAFVNTGSSSEYGFKDHPASETDWLDPNSPYAAAKASATLFCRLTAQTQHVWIPTLRLYSVYGPYEHPDRFIPTLIREGLQDRLPPLVEPETARDYVHVDDAVEAYLLAARAAPSEPGAVYNVGTGVQTSVGQAVDVARRVLQVSAEPQWGSLPARSWDTGVWVADNRKIAHELGWTPRFNFEDGFRDTVRWVRDFSINRQGVPVITRQRRSRSPVATLRATIPMGLIVLALLPPLGQALFIHRFGIDVPVWEQWTFLRQWDAFLGGGNWIRGLFDPYWEHHPVLPMLLFLLLGSVTKWSQMAEMYLGWALLCTLFAIYAGWLRRLQGPALLLLPFLSVGLFSLKGYSLILNGFNVMVYLALLLSAMAIGLCARHVMTPKRAALVLALTIAASLSWSYGLLLWPVVALFLLTREPRRRRVHYLAALALAALPTVYLIQRAGGPPTRGLAALGVERSATFVAALLGTPFTHGFSVRYAFAVAGLALLTSAALWLGRVNPLRMPCAPWSGVALQAAASILLIAAARGDDVANAINPHYAIVVIQLGLALLVLLAHCSEVIANRRPGLLRPAVARSLAIAPVAIFCAGTAVESVKSYQLILSWDPLRQSLADFVSRWPDQATVGQFLGVVEQDPDKIERGLAIMKRYRIGPFRRVADAASNQARRDPTARNPSEIQVGIEGVSMTSIGYLTVEGWAFDAGTGRPLSLIALRDGRAAGELGLGGLPRPDVARALGDQGALRSGWIMNVPPKALARVEKPLVISFIAADGLERDLRVPMPPPERASP